MPSVREEKGNWGATSRPRRFCRRCCLRDTFKVSLSLRLPQLPRDMRTKQLPRRMVGYSRGAAAGALITGSRPLASGPASWACSSCLLWFPLIICAARLLESIATARLPLALPSPSPWAHTRGWGQRACLSCSRSW